MTEHITTYSVKQAAQVVAIGVSTVRKYSLLLESKGYRISRDEQNARIFYDADILALRRLKEGTSGGRILDVVAQEVASAMAETAVIKGSPPAPNDAQAIRELKDTIEILSAKIDAMATEQEETRRAFQMALRKMDERHTEIIEMKAKEETAAASEPVVESKRGWWRFGK